MRFFNNFLALGLLVCVLAVNASIIPQQDTCFSYRLETTKFIRVNKGISSRNLFKMNFNFFWKPYNNLKNTFSLHIRDSEVTIDREISPKQINVGECLSYAIPGTRSLKAALVVFDDNGLLKELRVPKNEPNVVINVLLYLASLLQIDKSLVGESKSKGDTFNSTTTELLHLGKCPVSYEVTKENDQDGDNLRIVKKMKLKECSSVQKDRIDIEGVSVIEAKRVNDNLIPQLVLLHTPIIYTSKEVGSARVDVQATITLQDTIPCDHAPSFIKTDTISVTSQHLTPVNPKLFFSKDLRLVDIIEIYKAFSSEHVASNIYQDFYERALRCWERI